MNLIIAKPISALLLLGIFLTGCTKGQKSDPSDSFWKLSTPAAEGFSQQVLDSIDRDIQHGDYGLFDHLLLIRNGKIAFEHHYTWDYEAISQSHDTARHQYNYDHPEWHPYYKYSELHSLQSVSKTVTSLLLGIAMDEGLVIPVDSTILPLFSGYDIDLSDALKKSIKLRDLLTMQSGILWDESSTYADDAGNDCIVMELSDDWIQYVLSRPMDTVPGTKFVYNSGVSVLLGKIVAMATGMRVDKWAEEKLFGPLGITDYYWKITPKGEIDTEGGLYLKPHDLAKIGYLVLQKGNWEGQQIVSENWINESVQPRVQLSETMGYGYQWWLRTNGDETFSYDMRGYGGQFVKVIPKYHVVLVLNGWNIHDDPMKRSDRIFEDRILPAIR